MMLLTLRGTVFLYEGDEIGMTDVDVPRDELVDPVGIRFYPYAGRDPVRTPMQWTGEPGGGFTEPGVTPWLPFGDLACNVADQHGDPESFLALTKDLIAYRRAQPDLRTGAWTALDAPDGVLAYRRGADHVVVLNLGDADATVDGLDGSIALGHPAPPRGAADRRLGDARPERGRRHPPLTRTGTQSSPWSADSARRFAGDGLRPRPRGRRSRPGGRRAPRR